MMAFAIRRPDTAFSTVRQRIPRRKAGQHLKFIRALPCLVPGCAKRDIHAAHLRGPCPVYGKRATGAQEKPDDSWTVPLCDFHHVMGGPEAQHAMTEEQFWSLHGIDPFIVALALFRASGDEAAGKEIVRMAQTRVERRA